MGKKSEHYDLGSLADVQKSGKLLQQQQIPSLLNSKIVFL